ncbi:MAG: hypothetical protein OIF32_05520 [Campylobacterales bacterium]|nr:hypothetical protein [Campylobacterales bacterium]
MKLKMYILFSILLMVIVGGYIHFNVPKTFSMMVNGANLEFPIAVWMILPMFVMFLASFLHMSFYWFINYLKRRGLEKDISNVKTVVMDSLKGEPSMTTLNHPELAPIGKILKKSQLVPMEANIKTEDVDIDKLLFQVDKLNSGEEADLSSFKIPNSSPLMIRNASMKLAKDPKFAEEALKKFPNEKVITDSAIEKLTSFGDKRKIEKHKNKLNKKAVINILGRYKSEDGNGLNLSVGELESYIKTVGFKEKDYIEALQELKTHINPDKLLEIAYELKRDFSEALDGWIYVNLELEKMDEVEEILENSEEDEYLGFKKYLAVKKAGIPATVEEFIL